MKHRLSFTIILVFVVGIMGSFQSNAQVIDYDNIKEYEIGKITVEGAKYSDPDAIIGVTGLKVGQVLSIPGDEIAEAIRSLSRLSLFTDITVSVDEILGEVIFLKITVVERPRYTSHEWVGIKKTSQEDLDGLLNDHIRRGSIITENAKKNLETAILTFYREKGYLDARVHIAEREDTRRKNAIKLVISVDKSDKIKINSIVFEGIPEYDDFQLNMALKTGKLLKQLEETKPRSRFLSKSKYHENHYEEDKRRLIAYLNTLGFRDAQIVKDSIYRSEDGGVNVVVTLDMGSRYYFRNITWKGNTLYSDAVLSNILSIRKGDVYNEEELETRLRFSLNGTDISTLYMDDGYLFFQVEPTEIAIVNDSIDVEMRIFEGPQATIDKVVIKGNTRTHEHVIRRELRTIPGSKFSRTDIIRSQRQIMNLGYFDPEAMEINTPVNPQRGTVDIEYKLSERPSDQLELSAGWGGASGLIGTLGVTFNNFSLRNAKKLENWKPVPMGDGQRLSLRVQTNGSFYQSFNFSFTEPWLGGKKPNSFTFGGYYTKFSDQSRFDVEADGFLKIGRIYAGIGTRLKWPDDNFISNTTLNLENINLNNYGSFFRFEGRPVSRGNFNNIFISQTFARTSISEPLFPRRGSKISLTIQLTPPYSLFKPANFWELSPHQQTVLVDQENADRVLNGDPIMSPEEENNFIFQEETSERFKYLEYHKWRFDTEFYASLFGKFVFRFGSKMGFLGAYNNDIGVSPFERFELGGDGLNNQSAGITGKDIIRLRGYEVEDIQDQSQDDPVIFTKFEMELRYPISLNPNSTIYVMGFLVGGNSWNSFRDYNPFELRRTAGAGLRVFLPMFGLLGFDYGFGFDKPNLIARNASWTEYAKFSLVIGFEPE